MIKRFFQYLKDVFNFNTNSLDGTTITFSSTWVEDNVLNPNQVLYEEETFRPYTLVNGERQYQELEIPENFVGNFVYENSLNMTGFTMTTGNVGVYSAAIDPNYDPYTAKIYKRKEMDSLLKLITFNIAHEETKLKVRETISQFEGDLFSKEDFDRLVVMVTLAIDDMVVSDRVEATYSMWKESVDF